MIAAESGDSLVGRQIGVYRLVALLGAGGMGQVYRAHDSRLGRDVALKILPAAFTADPDRLARFEREARVLASLNHPNIGAIHGLEDHEGVRALVLELVDGETLVERIARPPRLSLDDALAIARQIADALDAAHEKGIVHRDLKPANVKLTPDGTVKVLDFGLATTTAGPREGVESATIPIGSTREGVIAGTAAYMSPEQARGQQVDKRTDIWAFGCVLYEMLTGRAAFARDTLTDTLAAVVNSEPEWTRLPADVPPGVRRLLRRCLARDAKQRLRDIGDVRIDLQDALAEPAAAELQALRGRSGRPPAAVVALVSVAAGALAAAIVTWSVLSYARPDAPPGSASAPVRVHRLTNARGLEEFPALSPDGRSVAFVAQVGGNLHIFVRLIGGGDTLQITRDAADHLYPRWSPDSVSILYYSPGADGNSPGAILEVPALGGPARRIAGSLGGGDISHDGLRLVFPRLADGRMELAVAGRDGSNAKALAPLEAGYYYLIQLPVVTGGSDVEIRVARPESAPSRVLARIPATRTAPWLAFQQVISPDGRWLALGLLDGAVTNLWAVSTSSRQLRQLTDFGQRPTFITRRVSWSSDGRSIFASVGEGDSDVVLLEGLTP